MKLYSTTNPNISVSPALGTEEEMETFVDQLIAASEIHDANAEKILRVGGREEKPAQGSSN